MHNYMQFVFLLLFLYLKAIHKVSYMCNEFEKNFSCFLCLKVFSFLLSLLSLTAIHLDFTITSAYLPDGDKVAKCFQFNISVCVHMFNISVYACFLYGDAVLIHTKEVSQRPCVQFSILYLFLVNVSGVYSMHCVL